MTDQQEQWKDIAEGYQVSNLDRVRSTKYKKPRIMKPGVLKKGHLQVTLRIDGVNQKFLVHRLVAEAFIPNPNNLPWIDHKDGDPSKNSIHDIEWTTPRGNSQNCLCHRDGSRPYVGTAYQADRSKWVAYIYSNGKGRFLGSYNTEKEAALAYDNALIQMGLHPVNFT